MKSKILKAVFCMAITLGLASCGKEIISGKNTDEVENFVENQIPTESGGSESFKNLSKNFRIDLNCDRGVGLQYMVSLSEPGGLIGGLEYFSDYTSASWNSGDLNYSATGQRSYQADLNFCSYNIGDQFLTRQFECKNILLHQSKPIEIYIHNNAGSELNCNLEYWNETASVWSLQYSRSLRIRAEGRYSAFVNIYTDSVEELLSSFD